MTRQEWARRYIAAAPDAPAYGTPEWMALPDDSPAKVAGCVRAAECWATEGDELEERLRAEVSSLGHLHKLAEDAEYVARRDAHSEEWGRRDYRPHPANRRARDDFGVAV